MPLSMVIRSITPAEPGSVANRGLHAMTDKVPAPAVDPTQVKLALAADPATANVTTPAPAPAVTMHDPKTEPKTAAVVAAQNGKVDPATDAVLVQTPTTPEEADAKARAAYELRKAARHTDKHINEEKTFVSNDDASDVSAPYAVAEQAVSDRTKGEMAAGAKRLAYHAEMAKKSAKIQADEEAAKTTAS